MYISEIRIKNFRNFKDKKVEFNEGVNVINVERDMLTGRNSLLKDVLDFFMDYEIKIAPETTKTKEEKLLEIKQKKVEFTEKADELLSDLQKRMSEGKKQILSYAKETGASFT